MSVLKLWVLSLQTRLSQFVLSKLHDPVNQPHPFLRIATDCMICIWVSLDVVSYKPTRDHRTTINSWNTFVLGRDYRLKAARLCPRTRQ